MVKNGKTCPKTDRIGRKNAKKVKKLVKLSNFDRTYHVTTHYIDGISPTTVSWLRGRYLWRWYEKNKLRLVG